MDQSSLVEHQNLKDDQEPAFNSARGSEGLVQTEEQKIESQPNNQMAFVQDSQQTFQNQEVQREMEEYESVDQSLDMLQLEKKKKILQL